MERSADADDEKAQRVTMDSIRCTIVAFAKMDGQGWCEKSVPLLFGASKSFFATLWKSCEKNYSDQGGFDSPQFHLEETSSFLITYWATN